MTDSIDTRLVETGPCRTRGCPREGQTWQAIPLDVDGTVILSRCPGCRPSRMMREASPAYGRTRRHEPEPTADYDF